MLTIEVIERIKAPTQHTSRTNNNHNTKASYKSSDIKGTRRTWQKIKFNSEGRAYIIKDNARFYLDDFARIENKPFYFNGLEIHGVAYLTASRALGIHISVDGSHAVAMYLI